MPDPQSPVGQLEDVVRLLAGLPANDAARIADTLPALSRHADSLGRSQTLGEVDR